MVYKLQVLDIYQTLEISPPARFALTRLPPPLLRHPLTEGLFNLVASTSERNYPQVYVRGRALGDALSADADCSVFGSSMVKAFLCENRHAKFQYCFL